ncbi:MAG: cupin domain-containing protein [Steroidobacteraceae bacterium]
MKIRRSAGLAAALLATGLALAQTAAVGPLLPDQLHWVNAPGLPGVRVTWVAGAEKTPGLYGQRVILLKGTRIPPHTHPDTRYSTVLSGTLLVGFGSRADDAALVAIPPGGVYIAPAGTPHFLWARDGEVTYQEAGIGPTATVMLPP